MDVPDPSLCLVRSRIILLCLVAALHLRPKSVPTMAAQIHWAVVILWGKWLLRSRCSSRGDWKEASPRTHAEMQRAAPSFAHLQPAVHQTEACCFWVFFFVFYSLPACRYEIVPMSANPPLLLQIHIRLFLGGTLIFQKAQQTAGEEQDCRCHLLRIIFLNGELGYKPLSGNPYRNPVK